jgi:hypothetical protein
MKLGDSKTSVFGASVRMALLIAVLGAAPAIAENLQFLWPSWENWVIANSAKEKGYAITEFVPEGQDITRWTQLLTIQNFSKKGFPGPEQAMAALKEKMAERCPSLVWNVIERIHEDVIYEWRVENCSSNPDQHEIARFLVGKQNVFRIAYTAKMKEISEERKKELLERLRQASIH